MLTYLRRFCRALSAYCPSPDEVNCPIIRSEVSSAIINCLFLCSLLTLTPALVAPGHPIVHHADLQKQGNSPPLGHPLNHRMSCKAAKCISSVECDWGSDCPSWPNTHTRDQGEQGILLLALSSLLFASYCSRRTPAQSPSHTHIHIPYPPPSL